MSLGFFPCASGCTGIARNAAFLGLMSTSLHARAIPGTSMPTSQGAEATTLLGEYHSDPGQVVVKWLLIRPAIVVDTFLPVWSPLAALRPASRALPTASAMDIVPYLVDASISHLLGRRSPSLRHVHSRACSSPSMRGIQHLQCLSKEPCL